MEECADPKREHYPFRRVCYRSMEREAANALYAKLHEKEPFHDGTFTSWAKDRSLEHPYHFKDGVSVGVADHDITPHDLFTTEVNASPGQPSDDDSQTPES